MNGSSGDSAGATSAGARAGWWAAGGIALVVALIIGAVAGGWFSRDTSRDAAGRPGLLSRGTYEPKDQQQADPCDGLPAVDPADLRLLDPDASVRSGVVCLDSVRLRPGDGRWTMRDVHEIPATALPRLIEALTRPDRDTSGACTAQLILVPGFVLTLEGGSRIRPGLPGDGCHVYSDMPFDALTAGPVRASVPVTQVATEQEVTTGCQPESKPPADWLGSASTFPVSEFTPIEPGTQQISLCRYRPDVATDAESDDDAAGGGRIAGGTLAAVGTMSADDINARLADLAETPSPECSESLSRGIAPDTDWLIAQRTPRQVADVPDTTAPLLALETDGCYRVVDAQQLTLLGYLSPADAGALSAAADEAAR